MERHDKWLSMMWPRLQLLRELLSNTGVIFVSIDDNEVQHLRCLMDEVFGVDNFLTQIVWKKRAGGGSDNRHFVSEFEYMLVYCRQIDAFDSLWVEYSEQELERFSEKDEQGEFYLKTLERPIALGARPNLQYSIQAPDGSTIVTRADGIKYTWVVGRRRFDFMLQSGEIVFKKTGTGSGEFLEKSIRARRRHGRCGSTWPTIETLTKSKRTYWAAVCLIMPSPRVSDVSTYGTD